MNRRGEIELSISTIVIIVIGVSMLIFGIILVRNIANQPEEVAPPINSPLPLYYEHPKFLCEKYNLQYLDSLRPYCVNEDLIFELTKINGRWYIKNA